MNSSINLKRSEHIKYARYNETFHHVTIKTIKVHYVGIPTLNSHI